MGNQSAGFFSKHPAKGAYTLLFLLTTLVRLPFLCLYYLPRRLRPHPTYSWRTSVVTTLFWSVNYFASVVELKAPLSLDAGKEGDRFIKIAPASKKAYVGVCNRQDQITPTTIGAIWVPKLMQKPDIQGKKVVLFLHGGAYVLMSARQYEKPIYKLTERFNSVVLCPEYRLATVPNGKFPAALQDAVSSYAYLLNDLGVDPAAIIFCGDSAGGHLVLSLLRYITDNPSAGLPLPAAAMLWSPWTDMLRTPEFLAAEDKNDKKDMIPASFGDWAIREFRRDVPLSDPYISPLQSPFYVPIPFWVSWSQTERIAKSIAVFVENMREKGNQIELYEVHGVPHDVLSVVEALSAWEQYEAALEDAWKSLRPAIAI